MVLSPDCRALRAVQELLLEKRTGEHHPAVLCAAAGSPRVMTVFWGWGGGISGFALFCAGEESRDEGSFQLVELY